MNKRSIKISVHILCWLFFICLVAAFLQNGNMNNQSWLQVAFSLPFLLFICFYAFIFYVNVYMLIPQFFLKKNYLAFGILAVGLLVLTFYVKPFEQVMQQTRGSAIRDQRPPGIEQRNMPPPQRPDPGSPPPGQRTMPQKQGQRIDILSLILFFMAMAGSSVIVLSKQWRMAEKNKALAEAQKANAELAFLKAQISPHFLFNVLNNIYALVITKNEDAASGILRLSNIMRYVTDDARADFVPVEKEIACINDFIALQKLRSGKNTSVNYTVTGAYGNVTVAPLILMAFVENTFKHGLSNNIPSAINIDISINESSIHLKTENTVFNKKSSERRDGVGLQNVVQRLELLYPGKHQLHISTDNDIFKVSLILQNAKV